MNRADRDLARRLARAVMSNYVRRLGAAWQDEAARLDEQIVSVIATHLDALGLEETA